VEKSWVPVARKEIADYMFSTGFNGRFYSDRWHLEIESVMSECSVSMKAGVEKHIQDFVSQGCDSRCLRIVLLMARDIHVFGMPSPAPPDRFTKLARQMRRLSYEISLIEFPGLLAVLNETERRKRLQCLKALGMQAPIDTGGDSVEFVQGELPLLLQHRAFAYDEWARLASDRAVPKNSRCAGLARVFVASYVKYATRKTHYPQVLEMLRYARLDYCSTEQLSKEVLEFERNYPRSYAKLKSVFEKFDPNPSLATPVSSGKHPMTKVSKRRR
jgi:hypothetical protein